MNPANPDPQPAGRTADTVGTALLFMVGMSGDACHSGPDDPCHTAKFVASEVWGLSSFVSIPLSFVVALVGVVHASRLGRRMWVWPLVGLAIMAVCGFGGFGLLWLVSGGVH
jgi:hypothetical protein